MSKHEELTKALYDQAKNIIEKEASFAADKNIRLQALERFKELGLPFKKTEDYKYSNLSNLVPNQIKLENQTVSQDTSKMDLPTTFKATFNNGRYSEAQSNLPEGLTLEAQKPLENIDTASLNDAMEALTLAVSFHHQFKVAKSKQVPLVAIVQNFTGQDDALYPAHISIQAEELSESKFVEVLSKTESEKTLFTTTLTTTKQEAGSHLLHQKVVLGDLFTKHVGKVRSSLEKDAQLNGQTLSTGAIFARNNIEVSIEGTGAHATVNGLFATRKEQHHDSFSHINHLVGHTTSEQIFKGILDDHSRGAFTGKIVIHRDAQLVDSSQLNKNLLLDQKAHVDTRPQLEVYADDVKCAHGATVGQMSEEELFYLESRGIEKTQAQKILCHAFAGEVFASCNDEDLTNWLNTQLYAHFEQFALDKLEQGHS